MSNNGSGPEPELPLASTHDVNLLEVTHGMQPTVEPERTIDGRTRRDDESDEQFSHRVARERAEALEKRKQLEYATEEKIHPLQKFARAWEGPSNSGTESISGGGGH